MVSGNLPTRTGGLIDVSGPRIGSDLVHDHYVRGYSNDAAPEIKFAPKENRVEWQANTFAAHFLLPDHLVRSFDDARTLAAHCSVPEQLAREHLASVGQSTGKRKRYTGEACPECNNFTLVRNGTCLKCDTCGATTGCS